MTAEEIKAMMIDLEEEHVYVGLDLKNGLTKLETS